MADLEAVLGLSVVGVLSMLLTLHVLRIEHRKVFAVCGGPLPRALSAAAQVTTVVYFLGALCHFVLAPVLPWVRAAVPWVLVMAAALCVLGVLEVLLQLTARRELRLPHDVVLGAWDRDCGLSFPRGAREAEGVQPDPHAVRARRASTRCARGRSDSGRPATRVCSVRPRCLVLRRHGLQRTDPEDDPAGGPPP